MRREDGKTEHTAAAAAAAASETTTPTAGSHSSLAFKQGVYVRIVHVWV